MLIIILLSLPLFLVGWSLYFVAKSGEVPSWLKWWSPMTGKLQSYKIDERYSHAEKMQIDGIVFMVLCFVLVSWFLLIYIFLIDLRLFREEATWLIALLVLFFARKLIEYMSIVILEKMELLKK